MEGRPNDVFMQRFPFKVSSGYLLFQCDASFISRSGCHPALCMQSILFHKDKQQNLTLTYRSDAQELLQQISAILMLPLSEHMVHKLLVRLTAANSVFISSQETGGTSAVENAAWSVADEFSP